MRRRVAAYPAEDRRRRSRKAPLKTDNAAVAAASAVIRNTFGGAPAADAGPDTTFIAVGTAGFATVVVALALTLPLFAVTVSVPVWESAEQLSGVDTSPLPSVVPPVGLTLQPLTPFAEKLTASPDAG